MYFLLSSNVITSAGAASPADDTYNAGSELEIEKGCFICPAGLGTYQIIRARWEGMSEVVTASRRRVLPVTLGTLIIHECSFSSPRSIYKRETTVFGHIRYGHISAIIIICIDVKLLNYRVTTTASYRMQGTFSAHGYVNSCLGECLALSLLEVLSLFSELPTGTCNTRTNETTFPTPYLQR